MEKSTFNALGKVLKQEFELPADLPLAMRKVLKALAELPYEAEEEGPHDPAPKATPKAPCCN